MFYLKNLIQSIERVPTNINVISDIDQLDTLCPTKCRLSDIDFVCVPSVFSGKKALLVINEISKRLEHHGQDAAFMVYDYCDDERLSVDALKRIYRPFTNISFLPLKEHSLATINKALDQLIVTRAKLLRKRRGSEIVEKYIRKEGGDAYGAMKRLNSYTNLGGANLNELWAPHLADMARRGDISEQEVDEISNSLDRQTVDQMTLVNTKTRIHLFKNDLKQAIDYRAEAFGVIARRARWLTDAVYLLCSASERQEPKKISSYSDLIKSLESVSQMFGDADDGELIMNAISMSRFYDGIIHYLGNECVIRYRELEFQKAIKLGKIVRGLCVKRCIRAKLDYNQALFYARQATRSQGAVKSSRAKFAYVEEAIGLVERSLDALPGFKKAERLRISLLNMKAVESVKIKNDRPRHLYLVTAAEG